MRSFDVAYRFRLLPTPSNIPPVRANAVIVVVVVVIVDIAGRRDAKKIQRTTYVFLFAFLGSPGNRHIFHVRYHSAPILRRSAAQYFQIHR